MAEKLRVVILGGGFSGVFAAKELQKLAGKEIEIELINQTNYFVFQPLLPEVAAGAINASDAVSSLRRLLPGVQVRLADIINVDFEKKAVTVVQGSRRLPIDVEYDHLVLSLGQSADLSRFPGLSEHALTMKTMSDAFKLRNHVIGCLENADVARVPDIKRQLLTFVVVGAGFSGVETVGEIKSFIDKSLHLYRNIDPSEVRVMLVEYADRILLELPASLATYAQTNLEKMGVEVLTGVGTKSASRGTVELTDGRVIESRTLVATIGTGPNSLVAGLPLELHWGKIKVDRTMRVPSHVNVWALGDAALIPLVDDPKEDRAHYAPPTAQFAVREGAQLAKNIVASIKGGKLKNFAYKSKGALAALGTNKAVAQVYGIKLSGVLAWLLWRGFYLSFLPGFAAKLRVLTNWTLNMFVNRSAVQVQMESVPATRFLHYRKDDNVFEPGMFADGFYTVMEGSFKLTVEHPKTGEKTERILTKGQHFGERVILGSSTYTGLCTALEDSVVMWVARDDFKRFAQGFPVLDNYFHDYIEKTFHEEVPEGRET